MSLTASTAGQSKAGAAKYQTTNATGSHPITLMTNPPSCIGTGAACAARYADAGAVEPRVGGPGGPGSPACGSRRTQTSHTISTSSMMSACQT